MKYCEEYAALLDAFADGELSEQETARVQAHLESCAGCRAYLNDIRAIRAAFPRAEEISVPDGFADGVMAAIREKAAPRRKGPSQWRKFLVPLAACLVVFVAVAGLRNMFPFGSSASTTADAASSQEGSSLADSMLGTSESQATLRSGSSGSAQEKSFAAMDSGSTGTTPKIEAQETGPASGGSSEPTATETPRMSSFAAVAPGANTTPAASETLYRKVLYLDAAAAGELLDSYQSTVIYDADGKAELLYELSEQEFDALAAQLSSATVTENQQIDTDLCCIILTNVN